LAFASASIALARNRVLRRGMLPQPVRHPDGIY
jgi:hypothetical protein